MGPGDDELESLDELHDDNPFEPEEAWESEVRDVEDAPEWEIEHPIDPYPSEYDDGFGELCCRGSCGERAPERAVFLDQLCSR